MQSLTPESLTPNSLNAATEAGTVFVHLCSGKTDVIKPATSIAVQLKFVIVYNDEAPVATYPRRDIYFCSKIETCPFPA